MEINGLPLHALVVHAAVVFAPLAALAGLGYALVPRWRRALHWPVVGFVLVALVSVWVAYLSGENLVENRPYGGPLGALVETHEERAEVLRLAITGYAAVAVASLFVRVQTGAARRVLDVLVGLLALVVAVYAVLTGDAGAQIAWYGA